HGVRQDDRYLELNQLGSQLPQPLCPPRSQAEFEDKVLPLDIAQLAQSLPKSLEEGSRGFSRRAENPDPGDLRRRLCCGSERRRDHAEHACHKKPDGVEPHRSFLFGLLSGLTALGSRTPRVRRGWKLKRSGSCKPSPARD